MTAGIILAFLGIILFLEGLAFLLFPASLKNLLEYFATVNLNKMRLLGAGAVLSGIALLAFACLLLT